jgi:hypothetical protein
MLDWRNPDLSFVLPLLVLLGVPALAVVMYRLARRLLCYGNRGGRSAIFGVVSVGFLLAGLIEWGIGGLQAVLVAKIVASDPQELWRRLGWLAVPVLSSGAALGLGAHGFRTWRRARTLTL